MLLKFKKWLKSFNISELSARLITAPAAQGDGPGLIMVQIDGLNRNQFESAVNAGRMPFLKKLIEKNHYSTSSFYSGLPSSTPAVQAELFYGVPGAIPAFGFLDRESHQFYNMLSSRMAGRIQSKLQASAVGLLEGGSAYSDNYTGGAECAAFCVTRMGLGHLGQVKNPLGFMVLILLNWFLWVRLAILLLIESGLAIIDLLRGIISKENFWMEAKFIPARVGICVMLRELVVAGVCIDTARGLPVIHCNLLGYDEQSHRRGPSSLFAHWTLKGIDDAIRRISNTAAKSRVRKYNLWIYSDHGQEYALPYARLHGKSIDQAIAEIIGSKITKAADQPTFDTGIQLERIVLLGSRFFHFLLGNRAKQGMGAVEMSAVGPIGHVYLNGSELSKAEIAEEIVEKAYVPAVVYVEDSGVVTAQTPEGKLKLPENGSIFLGSDHPFLEEVISDFISLVKGKYAGDLVLLGWRPKGIPITFPIENGAHAGPGRQETHGFVLTPPEAPVSINEKGYLRPLDLRKAAMKFLGRVEEKKERTF